MQTLGAFNQSVYRTQLTKVGSVTFKKEYLLLQELSLFVWIVMTCSARVGLSRSAVSSEISMHMHIILTIGTLLPVYKNIYQPQSKA